MQVTVGGKTRYNLPDVSLLEAGAVSYKPPSIDQVFSGDMSTEGGGLLIITGKNLGSSATGDDLLVTVGGNCGRLAAGVEPRCATNRDGKEAGFWKDIYKKINKHSKHQLIIVVALCVLIDVSGQYGCIRMK